MPDVWLPPYLCLDAALAQFIAVPETQGQQHIKPLHQHIAIRLVIEAGFHPEEITPHPPLLVETRGGRNKLAFDQRWNLDILHANGVRAHQPRAAPWETSLRWHSPPCKGGGSSSDLRPFRAPEHSEGLAFPGCYPGLICWRAFSACSRENSLEARMSKLQGWSSTSVPRGRTELAVRRKANSHHCE